MPQTDQNALDAGNRLQRALDGIFALEAAMQLAADPRARDLFPIVEQGQNVPIGRIPTKFDGDHQYHFAHFVEQASLEPSRTRILRFWSSQLLLIAGDLLQEYRYFDRAPELELIRHLRNAVAHGDRFEIRDPAKLVRHPAKLVTQYLPTSTDFEITPSLHGSPLYDFVDRGDVVAVIMSASMYLLRVGNGTNPRVI
ncbi:hypothetical protein [Sphingobium sp. SCG-1]|uniref:hypothetical protein n=1 Tax=Sphingobium sp. SCG-1 TaxID=2072936 RepID=UPI0011AB5EF1|nr:hypothetical protein [Sphingobium sp. SCG-1]